MRQFVMGVGYSVIILFLTCFVTGAIFALTADPKTRDARARRAEVSARARAFGRDYALVMFGGAIVVGFGGSFLGVLPGTRS
jgi:hypothetical protein